MLRRLLTECHRKCKKKCGFGPNFIQWIRLLYSAPKSIVRVNGCMSQPFTLERGMRQGCPLSPLLIALCIEPLAEIIRSNPDIQGIRVERELHKVSLYADDIIVYISDPLHSVPKLMECINKFGKHSGYKINVGKTEALAMNALITTQIECFFSFRWPKEGIKYLGVAIPCNLNKLYDGNYTKLLEKINSDLRRWSILPFSLSGRIEDVRMNILPRLLYLSRLFHCPHRYLCSLV